MSKDPIQSWLNNAGRFPLLPQEEMLRLAKKRDTLTPGSKAYVKVINKITNHNLRLIPTVVNRYLAKRVGLTMSSEVTNDLLQQGYLGLRRAAEKYEADRGYRFATYAYPWIYQAFTRWHNSHDRAIYIPENLMTETLYRQRHGKPSKSRDGATKGHLVAFAARSMHVNSIDVRMDDEESTRLVDIMDDSNRLYDPVNENPDWASLKLRDLMAECGIEPKAQDVVSLYARRGTMRIVAAKVDMSETRCRALYNDAFAKMKATVDKREAVKAAKWADRLKGT